MSFLYDTWVGGTAASFFEKRRRIHQSVNQHVHNAEHMRRHFKGSRTAVEPNPDVHTHQADWLPARAFFSLPQQIPVRMYKYRWVGVFIYMNDLLKEKSKLGVGRCV